MISGPYTSRALGNVDRELPLLGVLEWPPTENSVGTHTGSRTLMAAV